MAEIERGKPGKPEAKFRVVPSEETQFGKSGISYADYYGHGRIGDAVPYPGELPEEALAKYIAKGVREVARWGKDKLNTIWTKPTGAESSEVEKPQPPTRPQK